MGWIDCALPLHWQLDVEQEAVRNLAAFLLRYAALQTHTSAQLVQQLAAAEHQNGLAAPINEHHRSAQELLAELQP